MYGHNVQVEQVIQSLVFRIFELDPDRISQKFGLDLTWSKSEKNYLVIQWSDLNDLFLLDKARRPRHNKKRLLKSDW